MRPFSGSCAPCSSLHGRGGAAQPDGEHAFTDQQLTRWVRRQQLTRALDDPWIDIDHVLDLFDRVFLLEIDADTQEEPLGAYDISHPPGPQ